MTEGSSREEDPVPAKPKICTSWTLQEAFACADRFLDTLSDSGEELSSDVEARLTDN